MISQSSLVLAYLFDVCTTTRVLYRSHQGIRVISMFLFTKKCKFFIKGKKEKKIPASKTRCTTLHSCYFQPKLEFVYNLGNEYHTNDAEEATQKFLEREFPELLKCEIAKHEILFVPDTFIYGEVAKQVIFDYCIKVNFP